jgi:hypothetical protein
MGFSHSPKIATDGLVFVIDPANAKSYPGTGTAVNDLLSTTVGTITNATFSNNNNGIWVFDGTDDYINVSGLDSSFHTSQGSIEAWVKPSSDGSDQMVAGFGGGGTTGATRVIRINGSNWGYVTYGSGNEDWGGIASVAFNTWAHIVLGWNGTALTFWLNTTKYTTTRSGVVTPNSSVIRLGIAPWSTSDRPFEGSIAKYTSYSRLLTDSEIQQNYNALKGRFGL